MKIIDDSLLDEESVKAKASPRLRKNYNFHQSLDELCHRFLNVLEPGTRVPIHRHLKTSESVICLEGCLDWVFYEELPNMDAGGPIHDGENAADETCFAEVARFRVCPREKIFGIQVPLGAWHSIEVHEPSTIFEAKDGKYGK